MQATDPSTLKWWQTEILYQVYPRSFQDSNGDGIGDLQGIISRLDYLVDIGVGAVWLSPFFPSPQFDFGYDISDFCDIDPSYGTLKDFEQLVELFHKRGLRVLLDFVPGHSSHLHPWFQKSVQREEPYTDFYVWHDGKVDAGGQRLPPNNWSSVFGGTGWAWNDERQQFYYRPFLPEQPKLNYRCPRLVQEMKNVLRFWLDRGVDGFRVDAIAELVEAEDKSLDEPRDLQATCPPDEHEYLNHIYTAYLPETFEMVQQWAEILKEYSKGADNEKFMVIELYAESKFRNRFRTVGGVPFNMDLLNTLDTLGLSGNTIAGLVDSEYANLSEGQWPTFVLGNHDRHRIASRHGPQYADAFNMLLLTLKGTPVTYYGEEIAMRDVDVSFEESLDPWGKIMGPDRYKVYCRDPERSPMQWDSSPNSGFTTADKGWLPVDPNYRTHNVEEQRGSKQPSPLRLYQTLAKLRRTAVFQTGSICYGLVNSELFSYLREDPDSDRRYLVLLNFGKQLFKESGDPIFKGISQGVVVAHTSSVSPSLTFDKEVLLKDIALQPGDGVVLKV